LFLASCGSGGSGNSASPERITFTGGGELGIFDPPIANRYDGCRVYEFTDMDNSGLLRDDGSQLIEVTRADGEADLHNGACDALDGLDGGIIYSQYDPETAPETFRIYKSQVEIS